MPSPTSHITSLTADYEAIERAIRETSRGRWFLACYLERNRSAETKMLLSAIGKLENAMRENGQIVREHGGTSFDTLMTLRNALDQARDDMAQLARSKDRVAEMPLPRFSFEAAPSMMADTVEDVREAAASINSAAYALQAAGVFHSVARQISDRATQIEHACTTQDAMLARIHRMAALIGEIEAEILSAFDDDPSSADLPPFGTAEIRHFAYANDDRRIPNEVVEEISAALTEYELPDVDAPYPPSA
jgi:hypothetical protein